MKERLEKKLRKILAKEGLDEEQVDKIVAEVDDATTEEDVPEGANPEDAPNPEGEEEPVPPTPEEEEPVEEPAPEEPVPPAPAPEEPVPPTPVPPADGSIESVLENFNPTPEEVPPEGQPAPEGQPVPPAAPAPDPVIEELKAQYEEQKKANEGLQARVDTLEKALRDAGILEGEGTSAVVGVEQNIVPEDKKDDFSGTLDEVLTQVNNKNRY